MTSKRYSGFASWALAWLLLVSTSGCYPNAEATRSRSAEPHGHHGGHTFEMSDEADFEMEFTLDETRRRIVIYVHESDSHQPHPLAAETLAAAFEADGQHTDVVFEADPRPNDPSGRTSRFALSLDKLPQQLLASDHFQLQLSFPSAGGTVTGSITHRNDHVHEYRHD